LSLIYRITVLHLAAKIVPIIRKSSAGWDDSLATSDVASDVPAGFWDGRSLGEEPAVSYFAIRDDPSMGVQLISQNMRITTVVLSYRRAILISVYTHLLCELDPHGKTG
jgi:hypothetical protein